MRSVPDASDRNFVIRRPVSGGSREWLNALQTFPGWFQTQTTQQIRSVLSRDLHEKDSVSAVTIGWRGRTILRLVTRERKLIMLAIGMHDDFAIDSLATDVDSADPRLWAELNSENGAYRRLEKLGIKFRLPEIVTDVAAQAMRRCPADVTRGS